MTTPLICFYNNSLIQSDDFTRLQCQTNQTVKEFLISVQNEFSSELKIIQVDFDAFQKTKNNSNAKESHYISPKAQVYVVHTFKDYVQNSNLSAALQFVPKINKTDFIESVKKIKDDIFSGRYYQVNLATYFTSLSNESSLNLFLNYVPKFNSRYSALLPGNNFDILCFSPELFLRKNGQKITSQPIKGTGKNYEEILNSEKENAELSMIVDLIRNDLHLVSDTPAVVEKHRSEMKLSYATHTFSEISATTSKQLPEILEKMSPGGSISGCPKLEAVRAIHELENFNRQFYTGYIGWWKDEDFELNIAIRSILKTKDQLYYYAGCGIVSDSDPESEWNELLKKASALS